MSNVIHEVLADLGIVNITSLAYHPKSLRALERYHQTLKNLLCKSPMEYTKDWDQGVSLLLFASREVPQKGLSFSRNELGLAHQIRDPLSAVRNNWSCDPGRAETYCVPCKNSRPTWETPWRWLMKINVGPRKNEEVEGWELREFSIRIRPHRRRLRASGLVCERVAVMGWTHWKWMRVGPMVI